MPKTGLEITVGHRTLTDSEPILSKGNSLPSDTITDGELSERKRSKKFFSDFNYVKNLVIKYFTFTEHLTSNFSNSKVILTNVLNNVFLQDYYLSQSSACIFRPFQERRAHTREKV